MDIYEKLWPDKYCCQNDTYDIFHEFPLNLGIGKLKLWHLIIQDDKRLCVIPVIIHVIYIVRIYQENGEYNWKDLWQVVRVLGWTRGPSTLSRYKMEGNGCVEKFIVSEQLEKKKDISSHDLVLRLFGASQQIGVTIHLYIFRNSACYSKRFHSLLASVSNIITLN